jgi:maleate isomerase
MTQSDSLISLCEQQTQFLPTDAWQRLGLITLSTDLTTERDYRNLLPADGIGLYTSRVAFENPTTPENLKLMAPRLSVAAALLPDDQPLTAICYSCTAASVVIGDAAVTTAIQGHFKNTPVITPSLSAVRAFAALGATKISVLTPYTIKTSEPMAAYFTEHGLDILKFRCLGIEDDREMARVSAQSIIKAAIEADHHDSEALFISCTGLPAVSVIAQIEQRLGKPVVTSNQATAWMLLQYAKVDVAALNYPLKYGQLFSLAAPTFD